MEKLTKIATGLAPAASSTHGTDLVKKRVKWIAERGRTLSSSYRLDQFPDPDGYVRSVTKVLGDYPDEVIRYVTDERTGVQRSCEFPPTIAAIVRACDNHMAYLARLNRMENWGKRQDVKLLEQPREERPTLAELRAKYGENWGLTPKEPPPERKPQAPSWQSIISQYQAESGRIVRLARLIDEQAGYENQDMPDMRVPDTER